MVFVHDNKKEQAIQPAPILLDTTTDDRLISAFIIFFEFVPKDDITCIYKNLSCMVVKRIIQFEYEMTVYYIIVYLAFRKSCFQDNCKEVTIAGSPRAIVRKAAFDEFCNSVLHFTFTSFFSASVSFFPLSYIS